MMLEAYDYAAQRRLEREEARGFRATAYATLCQAQAALVRDGKDTPGVEVHLVSLMKQTALILLRYRQSTRDVRDQLARIATVARLEDLEFVQRTLLFYLAQPAAFPAWV